MSDKAVYRTAPATPGVLVITPFLSSLAQIFCLEYSRGRDLSMHQVQANVFKNGKIEETFKEAHIGNIINQLKQNLRLIRFTRRFTQGVRLLHLYLFHLSAWCLDE